MRVSYIGKKWVITSGRELGVRDTNNNMITFDTQQQAEDYLDKIKKCKYYSTDHMLGGMCKRCSSFKEAVPEIAFCVGMCENYTEFDPTKAIEYQTLLSVQPAEILTITAELETSYKI